MLKLKTADGVRRHRLAAAGCPTGQIEPIVVRGLLTHARGAVAALLARFRFVRSNSCLRTAPFAAPLLERVIDGVAQ
jgi:hypothetical protein